MKKSIFLFFAAILCAIGMNAATPEKLYLTPNANWKVDGARFAAYFFGNGETWVSMTKVAGEDNLYEVTTPAGYPSVIFCRMNPEDASNGWGTKWNQTGDLTVPTNGTNHYTVTENTWDNGGGNWSTYTPPTDPEEGGDGETTEPEEPATPDPMTLYLAPNSNWLEANARFAIYFMGGSANQTWADLTLVEGEENIYQVEVDKSTFTGLIFCRMKPDAAENKWDNKWNQTADLTIPTDGNNLFTVKDGVWDGATETWSVYTPSTGEEGGDGETTEPEEPATPDPMTLYLAPNSNWLEANARFAIYFMGGSADQTWADLTLVEGEENIYQVEVDKSTFTGLIFCRMNPDATANNWDNRWTQTADLTIPTDGTNCYKINNGSWDAGTWTTYPFEEEGGEVSPEVNIYTIAGDAAFVGKDWDINATENEMQAGSAANEYTLVKTDMTIAKGKYEYKVVCNHDWNDPGQFPTQGNQSVDVPENGIYKLTFTYIVGSELKVELLKTGSAEIETKYYVAGTLPGVEWNPQSFEMTADGKVYSAKFEDVPAETYSFRITSGGWSPSWGYTDMEGAYSEISAGESDNNFSLKLTKTTTFTILFDSEKEIIIFDGLTPATPVSAYTVTVPAGTEKCYIVGNFEESNWSTFIEMTRVGTEDKFTIEVGEGKAIAEANTANEYKYSASQSWDNQEVKDASDNPIDKNRTWSANDVVVKWQGIDLPKQTLTYTVTVPVGTKNCYLVGEINGWNVENAIEMTSIGGNKFQVIIDNATTVHQYKYTSTKSWSREEVQADLVTGVQNRTYQPNDVVAAWKPFEIGEDNNDGVINSDNNGLRDNVKVNRTFEANKLYTIALPVAVNNVTEIFGEDAIAYQFANLDKDASGLILQFKTVTSLAAGTPYLIEPSQKVEGFLLKNVVISTTQNSITKTVDGNTVVMKPVMSKNADKTDGSQYWLASDRYLYNNANTLKSLRALFSITFKQDVPPRARVAFNENVETGVEDIFTTDAPVKIIENGQLIIIHDGVKYNVQGQVIR